MTRDDVRRTFTDRFISVATVHPQYGPLDRGRIWHRPGNGWSMGWQPEDPDAALVGDGPVIGDYLDAERLLLDATSELDELAPASDMGGVR